MQLILVRHGQSVTNALGVHQRKDDPLSELGKQQAHLAAKRLSNVPVEKILVSEYTRAKETAEILSSYLKKPIHESPLIGEVKRPSLIVGKSHTDPEVQEVWRLIEHNYHRPGWKHSDEENFEDMKQRVLQFFEFIENSRDKTILAVSHGMFIRFTSSMMLHGKDITSQKFLQVEPTIPTENTSISICEYTKGKWTVISMCDCSHLESRDENSVDLLTPERSI